MERRVWELDQHINDRGFAIDLTMVENAAALAEELLDRANKKIWKLTDGRVKKVTEAAKICQWIRERGIPCESVAADEHEELILLSDMFDDPAVEEAVQLRGASSKAFKFKTMLAAVCRDGRIKGSLRYHATVQGRWAGAVVQPHNMKRVDTDEDAADVGLSVRILRGGHGVRFMADRFELLFPQPLETLSLCTRASIVAAPGHRLLGGDFSNIEGRICAWLAGAKWKLDAFRSFDAGTGPDLYKVTAGGILGIPPEQVTKPQRQETGKVSELSFQFQGAVGAYKRQGAKFGVRLPDARIKEFVQGWRARNIEIVGMWEQLENAAIEAVSAPGCVVECCGGKIAYTCNKQFLWCRLPSGRIISYASPSVSWKTKTIKVDGDEFEINRRTVSYWSFGKGKQQIDLYGGMQTAHVVSGTARDVLVSAMLRVEEAGYPLVLTVHDECLSEAPEGYGSVEDYLRLLLIKDAWFEEVPIAATAWEGPRYVK
jgi:DNA polymerase